METEKNVGEKMEYEIVLFPGLAHKTNPVYLRGIAPFDGERLMAKDSFNMAESD